jgi:ferrous iron transport protein B
MKHKILLVGQPNVGKSSLLNALVGPKVIVSNYPGTTVEITKAGKVIAGERIEFVDTPGIYSISDRSEEEKVTEKALFEETIDGAIIVADSSSLERSLYLAFQVLEAGLPVVLALNFIESAQKKGITINHQKLTRLLGVPVVDINPLTGYQIEKLINATLKIKESTPKPFSIKYDDHIEKAIENISSQILKDSLPKRFIALRILEGDTDFYKYLKDKEIIKETKQGLQQHPKVSQDIAITRFGTAAFIAEEVTRLVPVEEASESLEEHIDKIILHGVWGRLSLF